MPEGMIIVLGNSYQELSQNEKRVIKVQIAAYSSQEEETSVGIHRISKGEKNSRTIIKIRIRTSVKQMLCCFVAEKSQEAHSFFYFLTLHF